MPRFRNGVYYPTGSDRAVLIRDITLDDVDNFFNFFRSPSTKTQEQLEFECEEIEEERHEVETHVFQPRSLFRLTSHLIGESIKLLAICHTVLPRYVLKQLSFTDNVQEFINRVGISPHCFLCKSTRRYKNPNNHCQRCQNIRERIYVREIVMKWASNQ